MVFCSDFLPYRFITFKKQSILLKEHLDFSTDGSLSQIKTKLLFQCIPARRQETGPEDIMQAPWQTCVLFANLTAVEWAKIEGAPSAIKETAELLTCFVSYFCFCIEKVALEVRWAVQYFKAIASQPMRKVLISSLCSDGAPASLLL